ncbi:MAG: type II toxin-antitoxin system RelE/ParE family toxin [Gammaproteobacteria bacterium]|jgi:mRNA-degrading endonuclease RelE of RelBE toxin-antitoxin system
MVFIESSIFTKLIANYLDDMQYSELQKYLMNDPNIGVLIQGTGGLRKIRWTLGNKGKRGGARIIYFWKKPEEQIYLITIYAKNEIKDLSIKDKIMLKQIIEKWHHD